MCIRDRLYAFTNGGNEVRTLNFTFSNFARFLEPTYLNVFLKSFKLGLITTGICLLAGYPLAFLITRFTDKVQDMPVSYTHLLAVQYYAKPYLVANVPCPCFIPRPNVDSAVIRLNRYETPPVDVEDENLMFRLIRAAFNQRRKTLVNGLNNSLDIHADKEIISRAIETLGVSPTIRGEALTLSLKHI